jgi:hypothetical protein
VKQGGIERAFAMSNEHLLIGERNPKGRLASTSIETIEPNAFRRV